uniref:Uncharacterized protein n=1 Tax=Capra hircus TaxID=9925 RepID=A0A8C2RZN9_CAPHI
MGSRASTSLWREEMGPSAGKISSGFQVLSSSHLGTGSSVASFQREKIRPASMAS